MTIIINGFHKTEYFPVLDFLVESFQADECHIIYEAHQKQFKPEIRTHYYQCAVLSHEYRYGLSEKLVPLDAKILEALADCEAVCLKMMERDEITGEWSYQKRKDAYLSHLGHWHHIFSTRQVSAFISSNIPHVVYDYIIYSLAKLFAVPTLMFYQFQPGLSFLMRDWRDPTPGILQLMSQAAQNPESLGLLPTRLAQELSDHSAPGGVVPFYMLAGTTSEAPLSRLERFSMRLRGYVIRIFQIIRQPREFIPNLRKIIRKFFRYVGWSEDFTTNEARAKRYESLCNSPDYSIPYIYFPLHLQPELSTSPMAGTFVDQELIVEILSYCVPPGTQIYVKEHPNQNHLKRPMDYYERFLRCRGVSLISKTESSRDLIANAQAIATCTGTAGWEAVIQGKPVLLFGNTFYQHAPGVYPIRTTQDCRAALDSIAATPIAAQASDRLHLFLHCLDRYAVYADIDPDYMNSRAARWTENNAEIIRALSMSLKQNA